jgi:hypothetical protein
MEDRSYAFEKAGSAILDFFFLMVLWFELRALGL